MLLLLLLIACKPEAEDTGSPTLFAVSPDPGATVDDFHGQHFVVVLSSLEDPEGAWRVDGASVAGEARTQQGSLYTYAFSGDPVAESSVEFVYTGGSFTWTATSP